ncbi:hypothetical protein GGI1_07662, partial [Acidithiobacillus sp. GGI-221]
NEAMIQAGDKDRTVQQVHDKLGVDVLAKHREKGQELVQGVER